MMFMGPWEAGGEWNDDGINGNGTLDQPSLGPCQSRFKCVDESDTHPDAVRDSGASYIRPYAKSPKMWSASSSIRG